MSGSEGRGECRIFNRRDIASMKAFGIWETEHGSESASATTEFHPRSTLNYSSANNAVQR